MLLTVSSVVPTNTRLVNKSLAANGDELLITGQVLVVFT